MVKKAGKNKREANMKSLPKNLPEEVMDRVKQECKKCNTKVKMMIREGKKKIR